MARLDIPGLALLAALAAGCAAGPVAAPLPDAAASPMGAKRLLRLAAYEPAGKLDIVAIPAPEPNEPQRRLSPEDEIAKATALWRAVSGGAVGQPVEWSNGATGSHGTVEITREVPIPDSDRVCREYRAAFVAEGRSGREAGQVCQLRDGGWWKIEG